VKIKRTQRIFSWDRWAVSRWLKRGNSMYPDVKIPWTMVSIHFPKTNLILGKWGDNGLEYFYKQFLIHLSSDIDLDKIYISQWNLSTWIFCYNQQHQIKCSWDRIQKKFEKIIFHYDNYSYSDLFCFYMGIYQSEHKNKLMSHSFKNLYLNKKSVSSLNKYNNKKPRKDLDFYLHYAIENKELSVLYQPIYNIEKSSLMGFEALLRWNNKKYGFIGPDAFIPIAEKNNLIHSIFKWVLNQVAQTLHAWQQNAIFLPISINISATQWQDYRIITELENILKIYNIHPSTLKLEITETHNLYLNKNILFFTKKIKDLGYSLVLDDFGTGYASLQILKSISFEMVKIDKFFLKSIQKKKHYIILKMMVKMLHNLKIKVIIEGVESHYHLEILKKLNCQGAQGFYFSRALTLQDAELIVYRH
jgi:EAL domain-containing protein (putative c-di-GMP-specific phosphodiesterase class I)